MAIASEIYTYPVDAATPAARRARGGCLCRFRGPGEECDQSQHRGARAFVALDDYPSLKRNYDRSKIPLGLCSILIERDGRSEGWIVCPHRLFYAGPKSSGIEQYIYRLWGLEKGDKVGLWTEVKLKHIDRGKVFDFTLDYVFRKVTSEEPLQFADTPCLVEIMTASTSGGGVEECFVSALEGKARNTKTSINYRQVLARMMSQFVAKAQIAHEWGGKAVWIVQDVFWSYIVRTTGFDLDLFHDDPEGNVVLLVKKLEASGYRKSKPGYDEYRLKLERILRGWDRYERSLGHSNVGRDFASILNAPFTPDKSSVVALTNARPPLAVLTCD